MQKSQWPRLRPANNRDCEKVTELVYGVLREYDLKPDPAVTDVDIKDIEHSYFERGGTFYVLEEKDGSIIGAYGLYPLDRQTCELRKMYLHSSYRGKGLGKLLLEDAGLSVDEAENGKLGVEKAAAGGYDAILMDVQMPVMDGFTAAGILRKKGLEMPIIALTANISEDDRLACLQAGMNEFLSKPVSPERIFNILENFSPKPASPTTPTN